MGDPPAKQNKKVNIKGIVKLEKREADTLVSFEPLDFVHNRPMIIVQFKEHELFKSRKTGVSISRQKGGRLFCTFYNGFELGIEFAFYVPI
jgi:hypothetical protein